MFICQFICLFVSLSVALQIFPHGNPFTCLFLLVYVRLSVSRNKFRAYINFGILNLKSKKLHKSLNIKIVIYTNIFLSINLFSKISKYVEIYPICNSYRRYYIKR